MRIEAYGAGPGSERGRRPAGVAARLAVSLGYVGRAVAVALGAG
ncbi:hypothetical protein QIS99_21255 [Streptomyces sp. B-S-A8]|uniref:Uncharacterized protein n=1 Tax=Streptomyces solicavernae TaxID=3043614 RepID=A0ABT6RW98_9ACTN|nr:hypothetical protein [Streptomyces sp. B-S-A8]MDI3388712.1 hypothetical protein [Streptomyces sp. B-S-A8]